MASEADAPKGATLGDAAVRPRLTLATVSRYFARIGSDVGVFVALAEAHARHFDVTVVCSQKRRWPSSEPLRFLTVEPIVAGSGRFTHAGEVASFAWRAGHLCRRLRGMFDVVHSIGMGSDWADLVSVRAVRPAEVRHHFNQAEPMSRLAPRRFGHRLLRPTTAAVEWVERRTYRRGSPICITPTASIRDDLCRVYNVSPEHVMIIPDGIDVGAYRRDSRERAERRSELGVDEDAVVLLFVGDDFKRKGLDRVIAGFAGASVGDRLVVVGDPGVMSTGDPDIFRRQAARLGVSERVHFTGRIPFDQTRAWYSAADVFLLPSGQDSWGAPVVEALAAGCIPLASEFTGSHEALVEGTTGFVLEGRGEAAQISSLLDGPLADIERRRSMSQEGARDAARYDAALLYPLHQEAVYRAYQHRFDVAAGSTDPKFRRPSGRRAA